MKTPITAIVVGGVIGLAALAMACSSTSQGASSADSGASDPTQAAPAATVAVPTTAPVVAVAPTTAPVVAPTPAPAPTDAPSAPAGNTAPPANSAPPPPPPAPAAAASSTLTLELGDNSFAPSQLTVAAGTPITVTVNNGGKNMHNFDLQGVAKTPFQPAGQSQAVTFTVQPGTYTFICDVHPKEMIGTLIAQ